MIEIKLASENEIHKIKETFTSSAIMTDTDLFMVVKDGENLLGYATLQLSSKDFSIITDLYILPRERGMGLGDGLLRSTLNVIDLRGIRWVLIKNKVELKGFLDHEELSLLKEVNLPPELKEALVQWKEPFDLDQYYYCEPREFFSRKCKGNHYPTTTKKGY